MVVCVCVTRAGLELADIARASCKAAGSDDGWLRDVARPVWWRYHRPCALSCPCQAHLTTVKGILSYPETRVPGYPVDTVATPSNAMLAGGELHPCLL